MKHILMLAVLAACTVSVAQAETISINVDKYSGMGSSMVPTGWYSSWWGYGVVTGCDWDGSRNFSSYFYADVIGEIAAAAGVSANQIVINSASLNVNVIGFRYVWNPGDEAEGYPTANHTWQAFGITQDWSVGPVVVYDNHNGDLIVSAPSIGNGYGTATIDGAGWADTVPDRPMSFDITELVQAWANGQANYGVSLQDNTNVPEEQAWYTGAIYAYIKTPDSPYGGAAPLFAIDYSIVPEPASFMALGVGAAALLLRRRK